MNGSEILLHRASPAWRRLLFTVAASTAVVTGGALRAFEVLGPSWSTGRAPFWINPNFPDREISGSREQQIDIIRCAAAAWREQTAADFEFLYRGTTNRAGFDPSDTVNSVAWVDSDGGDALAATVISGVGGRMFGFDIAFFAETDGSTNIWSGPRDPARGTTDIAGVAVHELGHALGLDHTPIADATMFASVRNRGVTLRTLHADDRSGVESLYGTRARGPIRPSIESIEPSFGPASGGGEVIVRGANFTWSADTTLRIGSQALDPIRFEVESCGLIRIAPMVPGTGTVDVAVENELGSSILGGAYRYGAAPPSLTGVEPAIGPIAGGTAVTVTGENLSEDAVILIGGVPLENIQVVDDGTIVGTLPTAPEPGTVDVVLQQGEDVVELTDAFTYTAKILAIGSSAGGPGQSGIPVDVSASTDEPLRGVSFAFSYDPALLAVENVSVEGTAAEAAEFAAPNIDNEAGVTTMGIVMSFQTVEPAIPAADDQTIAHITAAIAEDLPPETEIPLHLEESGGSPPIHLLFTTIDDPGGTRPFAIDGKISVADGNLFIRGDGNRDGILNITDGVFLLAALFQGGEPTLCDDAADVNDDGRLDISDPIFLLLFLFSAGGEPPPPSGRPGVDPTSDDLDCRG